MKNLRFDSTTGYINHVYNRDEKPFTYKHKGIIKDKHIIKATYRTHINNNPNKLIYTSMKKQAYIPPEQEVYVIQCEQIICSSDTITSPDKPIGFDWTDEVPGLL